MYRVFLLWLAVFSTCSIAQDITHPIDLMPIPQKIRFTEKKYSLDEYFTISLHGHFHSRLYDGATRFLRILSRRTGLFFPQFYITPADSGANGSLQIHVKHPGKVTIDMDEAYELKIDEKGIILTANSDIGALRGLETLQQLLAASAIGYHFPGVEISDKPRFKWRGLLLDPSRHFLPVDVIKRNLDGMAALKMNVLHWHLTDDQGFRVECRSFPLLHEKASDGEYYRQNEIREIVQYAANRGIRVVPEFDVPAHATSWLVAYPELGSAPGPYAMERTWGIHDPVLNPANEKVYQFLDKFFAEMSALFPDEYMHIGGDENNGKHWKANRQIQSFMDQNNIKDFHELQTYFNKRLLAILKKYHKKMIGWDEIYHPQLPKDVIVHSWRGINSLFEAAKNGYQAILSKGYYIDLVQPAAFHYLNDPIPADSSIDEAAKSRILGGEATMWGEMVNEETIDSRIWPRTAAIAERLWSPRNVNDIDDMYRRLDRISFLLENYGLTHIKNYDMMLRRLTNNQDIEPLRIFVDVVEPLKIYQRHFQGVKYTTASPLSRVVDAARPESRKAREFAKAVDSLLADPTEEIQYRVSHQLKLWINNYRELEPIIEKSPILWEIRPLARKLSDVSELGLLAGKYLLSQSRPSAAWIERSLQFLEDSRKSYGQVTLAIIDPIVKMVKAVQEKQPPLKLD
jgi:hexosaminidase